MFRDPEVLEYRNIEIKLWRSKNDALSGIPEERDLVLAGGGVGSRNAGAERASVEPTRAAVAATQTLVYAARRGDVPIGLARTHLRADDSEPGGSIGCADAGIGNGERNAVLNRGNTGHVPSIGQQPERARMVPERQIVAIADDEPIRVAEI